MAGQSRLFSSDSEEINEASAREGYVKDFITGQLLKYTREEAVRQDLEHMLVEDYGYSKEQMDIEFRIQRGSLKDAERADIVVFNDEKGKEQMNIYIIVEAEPPEREFDNQVISYMTATPAAFCIWSNGRQTLFFTKSLQHPTRFEEIQQIPRKGETLGDIGKHLKSQLKPATNLKIMFENIHNQLYGSANIRRPEKLGAEMTKILFCKIYDEKSPDPKCQFRGTVDEVATDIGRKAIANRIRALFNSVKKEYSDVFSLLEEITLDDYSIMFIVSKLQYLSLVQTDTDAVGKAFEVFVPEELKGTKGEFFTARPVVRMSVDIINPSGLNKERVIDPACGSGGFLIVAMEKTRKDIDTKYKGTHLSPENVARIKSEYVRNSFCGIDVEPDLARICKAYMAIVGDGRSGIFCEDSLTKPSAWTEIMRDKVKLGGFDVLLTNPPFGTKISITRKDVLEQFDLGKEFEEGPSGEVVITSKVRKSQVPDILFLERCVQLLRPPANGSPGGRMAIVLPRGILNNPDKMDDRAARQWLLGHTRLLAVVDLSSDTFQPYTGTKTSVVFCQRVNEPPKEDYPIFMAISREIGHDKRGNPKFKKDADGVPILNGRGEMELDIDTFEIAADYTEFIRGHDFKQSRCSFVVSSQEVKKADRLDASFFNPAARSALKRITGSIRQGWQLRTVGELTKDVFFPKRFKRTYVDEQHGVPFISGANITRFTKVGVKYLSRKTPNLEDYFVRKGWILVTRSGTSGILVYADSSFDNVAVSEHVIRIVPDGTKVDGGYLFAVLSSPNYAPLFKSAITGSMVDEITPEFIKRLRVAVPDDRSVQEKIGKKVIDAEMKRTESMRLMDEVQDDLAFALAERKSPSSGGMRSSIS